jgi:cupin fold WbuC family metalloprotein
MIKIDKDFLAPILIKASNSERKRTNYNFHQFAEDTLQRMLNVLNTGTYVRPHKHENPDKREAFIILKGKIAVIEFDDMGNVIENILLTAHYDNYGCEIAPKSWHTIICLEDNSVIYEVKDGPYIATIDKNFASWAPEEGSEEADEYNKRLLEKLGIGY